MTQEKLKEGDCHYLREANAEVAWSVRFFTKIMDFRYISNQTVYMLG